MGFLYLAIKLPDALSITFLLNLFAQARFIFIATLTRFGLYKPPTDQEETNSSRENNSNNYIYVLEGTCPSFIPISIHVVTSAIKELVPIVLYRDSVFRQEQKDDEADQLYETKGCSICLECIEMEHEIRELCNCRHVFHRECLDTWIDEGQVACPLCRTMLLPPKTNLLRRSCNTIEN